MPYDWWKNNSLRSYYTGHFESGAGVDPHEPKAAVRPSIRLYLTEASTLEPLAGA